MKRDSMGAYVHRRRDTPSPLVAYVLNALPLMTKDIQWMLHAVSEPKLERNFT